MHAVTYHFLSLAYGYIVVHLTAGVIPFSLTCSESATRGCRTPGSFCAFAVKWSKTALMTSTCSGRPGKRRTKSSAVWSGDRTSRADSYNWMARQQSQTFRKQTTELLWLSDYLPLTVQVQNQSNYQPLSSLLMRNRLNNNKLTNILVRKTKTKLSPTSVLFVFVIHVSSFSYINELLYCEPCWNSSSTWHFW